uniref:Ig-like domain-containing protein n=1 Tax=Chrysemys picta bellii TaxID=8478 RepID=A0A8C3FE43_CHRPI
TPHPPTHFPALSAGSQLSPFPTGIHTQQLHKSCALSDQAPVDPRFQFAYDGGDFISFDNQTGTWFPAVQVALVQKQRWEADKTWTQHVQSWLQYECPRRLQRLLQSGGKILEQQVPPEISVSRRDAPDGSATLSCRASGFYPRPIHVSWVRDGEDILAETGSSGILPNADGTYYTQSSLEISPQQDGHRYACRVEHSSLPEPALVWAPGKKGPLHPGVLAAIVLAVLVLAGAVGVGVILWRRKSAGKSRSHGAGMWGGLGSGAAQPAQGGMAPSVVLKVLHRIFSGRIRQNATFAIPDEPPQGRERGPRRAPVLLHDSARTPPQLLPRSVRRRAQERRAAPGVPSPPASHSRLRWPGG